MQLWQKSATTRSMECLPSAECTSPHTHTHTHDTHAALPCPVVLNVQQTVWNAADASARWHTQTCGAVAGDCGSGGVSDWRGDGAR